MVVAATDREEQSALRSWLLVVASSSGMGCRFSKVCRLFRGPSRVAARRSVKSYLVRGYLGGTDASRVKRVGMCLSRFLCGGNVEVGKSKQKFVT
jgi:hypothetical protein